MEPISILRKLEIIIKAVICRLFHDEYSEIIYYSPQNLCYTAQCLVCGRLTYIGAGERLPSGFYEKEPENHKTILDMLCNKEGEL